MKYVSALDYVKDWNTGRKTLKQGIEQAKKLGVSDETIQNIATQEEELLKELWHVGTPEERKVLATLIFKLVQ